MADSEPTRLRIFLKYASLLAHILATAITTLSMRYAVVKSSKEELYFMSTAVVMGEFLKLGINLSAVLYDEKFNICRFGRSLKKTFLDNKLDTLNVCVPSFVFVLQNNLHYVGSANLDAATFLVTYQFRILTTAIFAVLLLRTKLFCTQWGSLLLLFVGVATIQLGSNDNDSSKSEADPNLNNFIGLAATFGACLTNGFACIYFEKLLKGSDISLWLRNVQMCLLSIPFSILPCLMEYKDISAKGFFHGYDWFVVYVIALNAFSGIISSMVMKYADNILKGFASALAIIVTTVASMFLFHFRPEWAFAVGSLAVIIAILLYNYRPNKSNEMKTDENTETNDTETTTDEYGKYHKDVESTQTSIDVC